MNRTITVALLLIALALVGFLVFVSPQIKSTRDRKNTGGYLLDIVPGQTRFITITSGTQHIELKKGDNGWKIKAPIKDIASGEAVEKILLAAQNARILDTINESSMRQDGLKTRDFGLAGEKQTLELGGDQKVKFLFGKDAAGEKRVYVRRADSDDIFVINTDLQDAAFRKLDDFRDTRLTNLDSDQITSFIIRRIGGEMELQRDASRWNITKPIRCEADSARVNEFLDQILKMQILKIIPDDSAGKNPDPLSDAPVQLILRTENSNGKDTVLRLGSVAEDNPDAVTAYLTSRDSLYELSKSLPDKLNVTPESFRDTALLRMNPDVLDRILIEADGQTISLQRGESGWKASVQGEEKSIPQQTVADLFRALQEMKVERFTTTSNQDLVKYGLDHPALTVRLQSWLSENTPEEQAGEQEVGRIEFGKREGDKIYARKDGRQEVLLLPADAFELIKAGPDAWSAAPSGAK